MEKEGAVHTIEVSHNVKYLTAPQMHLLAGGGQVEVRDAFAMTWFAGTGGAC